MLANTQLDGQITIRLYKLYVYEKYLIDGIVWTRKQ